MKKLVETKTILDVIEERGGARGRAKGLTKGRIAGKVEIIQTIVLLRFQNSSERSTPLLTELDNLTLLEEVCQFALIAPSLPELENFASILAQIKPGLKCNVKKRRLEVL